MRKILQVVWRGDSFLFLFVNVYCSSYVSHGDWPRERRVESLEWFARQHRWIQSILGTVFNSTGIVGSPTVFSSFLLTLSVIHSSFWYQLFLVSLSLLSHFLSLCFYIYIYIYLSVPRLSSSRIKIPHSRIPPRDIALRLSEYSTSLRWRWTITTTRYDLHVLLRKRFLFCARCACWKFD